MGYGGDLETHHGEAVLETTYQFFRQNSFAPVPARAADEDHLFRRKCRSAHNSVHRTSNYFSTLMIQLEDIAAVKTLSQKDK
jgi:hypothetical protein